METVHLCIFSRSLPENSKSRDTQRGKQNGNLVLKANS